MEKGEKLKWVCCGQFIAFLTHTSLGLSRAAVPLSESCQTLPSRDLAFFFLNFCLVMSIFLLRLRCVSFLFALIRPLDAARGGIVAWRRREISRGAALPSVDGQLRLSNFARRTHAQLVK